MENLGKLVIVIFVAIVVMLAEQWLPQIPSWSIIVVAAVAFYLWKGTTLFNR